MAMQDNTRGAIKHLKHLVYSPKIPIDSFRTKMKKEFSSVFLPNKVELTQYNYANINCDILVPELYSSNRILLYIHGGCYVGGSRESYRTFCSSLASKAFSRVVVPEYRLSPEYKYPCAIEDIQSVFRALFTEEQIACSLNSDDGKSIYPEFILVADGSAASLVFSLLFNLRDKYLSCIKNVILFSPWLDVSESSRILSAKKMSDKVLSADIIRYCSQEYTYAANTNSPSISPLLAEDEMLKNLPPIFIQMGEDEILLEDAKYFIERLKECGNECTLDVWKNMMYMFQMADSYLSCSHLAMDKVGRIITNHNEGLEKVKIENQPTLEFSLNSEA